MIKCQKEVLGRCWNPLIIKTRWCSDVPLPGWNRPTPPSIDGLGSRTDAQSAHLILRTFRDRKPTADSIIAYLKKLKFQGDAIGVFSFNAGLKSLVSSLPSSAKIDRHADRLQKEMAYRGVLPDTTTYELLVYIYGKAGLYDRSLAIKKTMLGKGFKMTDAAMTNLIRVAPDAYERKKLLSEQTLSAGQLEAAIQASLTPDEAFEYIEALHDFSNGNHVPGLKSLSRLLHLSASVGNEAATLEVFNLIRDQGLALDVVVWTSLMSVYKQIGDISKAAHCFIEMIKNHINPTHHTYATLLLTILNCGKLTSSEKVNAAEAIVSQACQVLPPSIHIFTIMMRIYAAVGDGAAASRLLSRIKRDYGIKETAPLKQYHLKAVRSPKHSVARQKMTFEAAMKFCAGHASQQLKKVNERLK
eukprot:TRINITY_DN14998_c0_g1_i1.p1 TRINITY_DN14998_c0_g1~~TRINITY_DN14998_c0_g1_i1.p1  ORF type:complete len:415 (+),score=61.53 TRINITY_DN14998_c0_g1_i1:63-1307(+)